MNAEIRFCSAKTIDYDVEFSGEGLLSNEFRYTCIDNVFIMYNVVSGVTAFVYGKPDGSMYMQRIKHQSDTIVTESIVLHTEDGRQIWYNPESDRFVTTEKRRQYTKLDQVVVGDILSVDDADEFEKVEVVMVSNNILSPRIVARVISSDPTYNGLLAEVYCPTFWREYIVDDCYFVDDICTGSLTYRLNTPICFC